MSSDPCISSSLINTLLIKRWRQEMGICEGVDYFQTDKGRQIQTHSYRITVGRAIFLVP